MKTYIGIDPGSKGYLVAIRENSIIDSISIEGHTIYQVADWLNDIQFGNEAVVAVIEEVHAIYGSSAKGTFAFGEIFGLLKGLLIAYKIPFTEVPPKTWQKEIWTTGDKVKKAGKVDNKPTSINAAHRLYPNHDFRRTPKCQTVHDGYCDAALIATYGMRKNL